jgi:hypothetical protein
MDTLMVAVGGVAAGDRQGARGLLRNFPVSVGSDEDIIHHQGAFSTCPLGAICLQENLEKVNKDKSHIESRDGLKSQFTEE